MRTYTVTLRGETPLILHHDNIAWADAMTKWKNDPAVKAEKSSVAGDDRSPAWRWIGCLYVESSQVVMPSDNLMTMLREGGKKCPTGKGKGSFKAQTQSGIVVNEIAWPILANGAAVNYSEFKPLVGDKETPFETHEEIARKQGFTLFVKRARVGTAKHIRVRPRFDKWSTSGTLTVLDNDITTEVLANILAMAGRYAGLGDWRPSSPMAPGRYGTFTAQIEEVK